MSIDYIIKVENLTKKFGDFTACDSISFNIERGEVFGFLGANGAGKTTAMRMLCGLLKPTSGSAVIAGYDIYDQTAEIKLNIGYMSQRFSLYDDLSIIENLNFYGGIYRIPKKIIAQKTVDLLKRFELEAVKDMQIRALPAGWKQKLSFAAAILHNPKIVFLDEPTSGVDPICRRQFWELIYEASGRGITVFVTTHYMDEAEYCGRIAIMSAGRIKALANPDVLKKKFGVTSINDVFLNLAR